MTTATAEATPNIAFIKYWGNRDNTLRIPMNSSISMNLDGLYTRTTVSFQPSLPKILRDHKHTNNITPTSIGFRWHIAEHQGKSNINMIN